MLEKEFKGKMLRKESRYNNTYCFTELVHIMDEEVLAIALFVVEHCFSQAKLTRGNSCVTS